MSSANPNRSEAVPIEERSEEKAGLSLPRALGRLKQQARKLAGITLGFDRRWVGLLLLVAAGALLWPALAGRAGSHAAPAVAVTSGLRTVAAAPVVREDLFNEVSISAEFRPYAEVELHAKVSGYVQTITVDIGDRVKAGQLLATLEVPELKAEVNRSLAAQQRAEADYKDAHLTYTRLLGVNHDRPGLLAQQDLDTAEARDATTAAALAFAKADVEKNRTLLAYTRIIAPFDGVVTHRYADPGTLIQSGTASDTQSLPLVQLADMYRLRLDFPVSVAYVGDIRAADSVEIRVESLAGKNITGTISRFTHNVSEATRTMMTEIEVANPNLELMPGMYAKVLLRAQKCPHVLSVPVEAVASGENPTVYIISSEGRIEERSVTLGLETPTRFEIKDGLKEGELVLIGSRSELVPGEKVLPKLIGPLALQ